MEQLIPILAKVLFFAVIAGLFTFVGRTFVRTHKADKRMREAWAELPRVASERGWTYEQHARGQATQYCGIGPMPGSGSNLSAWHYITGEFRGRSFKCFEHRYNSPTSGNQAGDRERPTIEAVFMITTPGSGQPVEVLRPSKTDVLLDRRSRMRLDLPEFDDDFRVVTKDENFARNFLSGSLPSFLLTDPRAKKSPLQLRDGELFTWYTGTLSHEALEEKLNYLCDVLDQIPALAWTAA
ncbi:hypothetical protein ADK65_05430 [Streptomyces sp. NRRL B-1140]|uniref:hypothetical protein n=1 Tax=Streptomyces sp. NRRL B-1140 TaxID=1415549 RepID=UPI0006AE9160|nr:hypothetical protein [Streptomyces sp. NRRL B-1140]KOX03680.1 hypothetical protein ADK65_05430 [Streptomyces sp. NRRL B-1140]